MSYAKVVLGLPVEGPFDYIIPRQISSKIKEGARVWVPFGNRDMVGYVVRICAISAFSKLKTINTLIDDVPVLDRNMLSLTRELARYYCCSWGQSIETALPPALRIGRRISLAPERDSFVRGIANVEKILLHDLDSEARWSVYTKRIKETMKLGRGVIVILPDIEYVLRARELLNSRLGISPTTLHRRQASELKDWIDVKDGRSSLVVGTRSCIFSPLRDLGLVIIEDEHNPVYKQDQVPHYHAREVALMRSRLQKSNLILGSIQPSLESLRLAQKKELEYVFVPCKATTEVKIIDLNQSAFRNRRDNASISTFLQDAIYSVLNKKGKALLFLNRKGFATFAFCMHCGYSLKCPRCNINLVFHFKDNQLSCHYCNFKMPPPQICPNCNAGYIKFQGAGTEKIESELSRLFPQARIERLEAANGFNYKDTDIFVAASAIIKQPHLEFDLVGVLFIDNSLNLVDLRASEKTFAMLVGLLGLSHGMMIIQTRLPNHHVFKALVAKDINLFYEAELRQRRQLGFPPYRHMVLIRLRSKREEKAKKACYSLLERLNKNNRDRKIRIISANQGQPAKLRGNFYWQILINCVDPKRASAFIKLYLKDFSHSGIIITVDVDPF